jgi:putative endonuclease
VTVILKFTDWLRHQLRRRRWKPDLALGRRGEDLAHRYLQKRGYVVVARNYRLAAGDAEADIIAWQEDTLVFVEVKSRQTDEFGTPERAMGPDKEAHLKRVAREYLRKSGVAPENARFDVVTVVFSPAHQRKPAIQLLPNAFSI